MEVQIDESQSSGSPEWRRQVHRNYAEKLDQILRSFDELDKDVADFDDAQLAALGVKRIAPLDVDEEALGFDPLFFRPLPASGLEQLPRPLPSSEPWHPRCPGYPSDDDIDEDSFRFCENEREAEGRLLWSMGACPDLLKRHTDWRVERVCAVTEDGSKHPVLHYGHYRSMNRYTFQLVANFETDMESRWAPRLAASVFQTIEAQEARALRCEVFSALLMMKREALSGDAIDHHTLPILIFSFHHDQTARITQFHFNGCEILMRQSRLLCLDRDEPTSDVELMVRWMVSSPVGETKIVDPGDATPRQELRSRREGSAELIAVTG